MKRRYLFLSIAVFFLLLAVRRPDSLLRPQFFAEDGTLFFEDQLTGGLGPSLFSAYSGYLHVLPRLVAALATFFPAHSAPLVYNLAALMVNTLCCWLFLLPCYRGLIRSDGLRFLLCLFVAAGTWANELAGILTNVQWYLAIALLLMLALPDDLPRPYLYAAGAFSLFAGISSGAVVLLAPIALWKLRRPRWAAAIPAAAVCAAALVQLAVLATSPNQSSLEVWPGMLSVARGTVIALACRVVSTSTIGRPLTDLIWNSWGKLALFLPLAAIAVWLEILWRASKPEVRARIAACVYLIVVSVAVPMKVRLLATSFAFWRPLPAGEQRYYFLPACLFIYLIALSLEHFRRSPGILAVVLAGAFVGNFHIPPLRDLNWPDSAVAVDEWVAHKQADQPAQAVEIPINPAPFSVSLPALEGR